VESEERKKLLQLFETSKINVPLTTHCKLLINIEFQCRKYKSVGVMFLFLKKVTSPQLYKSKVTKGDNIHDCLKNYGNIGSIRGCGEVWVNVTFLVYVSRQEQYLNILCCCFNIIILA